MRKHFRLFAVALAFGITTEFAQAGDWIEKIYVRYEPAQTFKRISEYFTGEESMDTRLIVRQPAEERAGLYWILRTQQPLNTLPEGSALRVSFIRKGRSEIETRTYPLTSPGKQRTLYAGITGADWHDADALPVAWKVELIDAQEQPLDAAQSFLWAFPENDQPEA